ncbi:hypothetical protein K402DRAFT_389219 [Aulographum hederae CBS 113979]|uniref:Uncharacterized protein n=1 Tax=Aulographum hederae CBS 113979 TaxID=1176131 RepID=A0A6G1HDB6_9PEZI|nr:hypothetical protein K402DRAFT_389219 [Aulographum hederae CBS 113979]
MEDTALALRKYLVRCVLLICLISNFWDERRARMRMNGREEEERNEQETWPLKTRQRKAGVKKPEWEEEE